MQKRASPKLLTVKWNKNALIAVIVLVVTLLAISIASLVLNILQSNDLSHINAETGYETCYDDNPCTTDFYQYEACIYLPSKNGLACDTPCVTGGTCLVGECVDGVCAGDCTTSQDCPDLKVEDENGDALPATCDHHGVCVWTMAYEDSDLPLAGTTLGQRKCEACVSASPFAECLAADMTLNNTCLYHFKCANYQE